MRVCSTKNYKNTNSEEFRKLFKFLYSQLEIIVFLQILALVRSQEKTYFLIFMKRVIMSN